MPSGHASRLMDPRGFFFLDKLGGFQLVMGVPGFSSSILDWDFEEQTIQLLGYPYDYGNPQTKASQEWWSFIDDSHPSPATQLVETALQVTPESTARGPWDRRRRQAKPMVFWNSWRW